MTQMPTTSYFWKLAALSVAAWRENSTGRREELAVLLAGWRIGVPQKESKQSAGELQDRWQEVLSQALALQPQQEDDKSQPSAAKGKTSQTPRAQAENIVKCA